MKTILKAYWPTAKKYVWLMLAMLVCMVLSVVANALYPFLLREFMNGFTDGNGAAIVQALWYVLWLVVANNAMWLGLDIATAHFEPRCIRDLDQRSFRAIQAQSMRFFENSMAGSLVTSARRFCSSFEGIVDIIIYNLGRSITMIVLTFSVFIYERPMLALVFGIWIAIYLAISVYFAILRMRWGQVVAEKDSDVGGAFADAFTNQLAVKSFGMERQEEKRFDGVTEDCYKHRKSTYLYGMLLLRLQGIAAGIFELVVLCILVRGWYNKTVTVADFVFFQSYVIILISHVWHIGIATTRIFRYLADAKQMAEIYAQESEVQDAPGARSLVVEEGEIEFHAVNFNYIDRETREHNDVEDFTLHIKSGQTLALVGHSGAGKSTLVKLLLRHFDLNSGYIRIDRQDIANVTQLSLRQQIAVVPQDPCLFHRSLRDNIAFARPDASDDEIIVATQRAHAWEFIQRLPKGLDTLVGERGVKLSGGERQRVALARAFLADAPILVLDEATSALDSETEHQIQSAIADLLKGRTCIVIAHRLSTIRCASRIIVMENGSIKEDGTHKELLSQEGVYANLWTHQSGGYIK
jgi:ATP-binding cassette subfamily B protein